MKTFTLLHFCAQITGAVRDFLCSEFSARRGPFAGVPAVLAEGFAGEGVRVERPVLQAHIVRRERVQEGSHDGAQDVSGVFTSGRGRAPPARSALETLS